MPEDHRSFHLAVGCGGNPPSGFYDVDVLAPSDQTTGANGNKPSHTQNRVHYVTALPGVGKTHLSVSLAEAAIQAGFGAYFMTAHDLVNDLGRAYREGRLDRRMRVYLAPRFSSSTKWDICRSMTSARPSSSNWLAPVMSAAASFSPAIKAMAIGAPSSGIKSSRQPFWTACSITPQPSTFAARVTGSKTVAGRGCCRGPKTSSPSPLLLSSPLWRSTLVANGAVRYEFFRHQQIYRPMHAQACKRDSSLALPPPSSDESATGYSSASCTPALLASASPAIHDREATSRKPSTTTQSGLGNFQSAKRGFFVRR